MITLIDNMWYLIDNSLHGFVRHKDVRHIIMHYAAYRQSISVKNASNWWKHMTFFFLFWGKKRKKDTQSHLMICSPTALQLFDSITIFIGSLPTHTKKNIAVKSFGIYIYFMRFLFRDSQVLWHKKVLKTSTYFLVV